MLDLKHTFIYFLVFLVLCVGLPLEKLGKMWVLKQNQLRTTKTVKNYENQSGAQTTMIKEKNLKTREKKQIEVDITIIQLGADAQCTENTCAAYKGQKSHGPFICLFVPVAV